MRWLVPKELVILFITRHCNCYPLFITVMILEKAGVKRTGKYLKRSPPANRSREMHNKQQPFS